MGTILIKTIDKGAYQQKTLRNHYRDTVVERSVVEYYEGGDGGDGVGAETNFIGEKQILQCFDAF